MRERRQAQRGHAAGRQWGAGGRSPLERLIEATYTCARRPHLAAANLGIEKLRVLCRLAKDLRHLDARRYAHAARTTKLA